ncbi:MAG: ATP-dependent Clp protease ATP-binding subunit [Candidatus Vogelbacteria bacterium]|nr:ATP-dependent Clp protease ATP-binding subunit [Candidatus Vogelbacteria bacterium]
MKLSQFNKNTIPFLPILALEQVISHKIRHRVITASQYIIALFLAGLCISKLYHHVIPVLANLLGLALILIGISVVVSLLEAFFRSYYYFGITFSELDAGRIIYQTKSGDAVRALFSIPLGEKIRLRAGIPIDSLKSFLISRGEIMPDIELPDVGLDHFFSTSDLVGAMFRGDDKFSKFLFGFGIGGKELIQILDWINYENERSAKKERWWSRENLSNRRAIGKEWSFGRTPILDKFSTDLSMDPNIFNQGRERSYRNDLVGQIEIVFTRATGANVIVVGDPGVGVFGVILDFIRKIVSGRVSPNIAYSRVLDLDWNKLISESREKTVFEDNFTRCLNESIYSGNIIFVIQDLPSFMASSEALGTQLSSLLSPYLDKNVRFVATADPTKFHQLVEANSVFNQYFEKIKVEEPDEQKTLEIVEKNLRDVELSHNFTFTFLSVKEIIRSATYYITSGVMPSKAINLVTELSAQASFAGLKVIGKSDVLNFIRTKTNIPVGDIGQDEKQTLLNLEVELHKRVIGQGQAITAISNAMRRSRAGVRDPKKPIGSFLFLGPTGVGKTETAKALAQIFYGDEKYMLRLDMTEYQSGDSLNRLIGSFQEGKPGVLSSMLRESPYGVLLLDEFEKADKDVLNLFLQILDEGFFSDMTGKKVSTQNIIFIATSNAASQMIFDITEKGNDPTIYKTDIINKIVSDGIYKPELINRFDDVVIFHPLNKDELQQITGLMLKKLAKRLQEKGIELVVNPLLTGKIMNAGYNRTFGARPMNRAIQEQVEEPIAKKIIEGSLIPGAKMEFTEADFPTTEPDVSGSILGETTKS